jgi:RimJ/RimL family protein N-acetyltransferase
VARSVTPVSPRGGRGAIPHLRDPDKLDRALAFAAVPGPAYRIVTERLVVRCWEPADAPALKRAVDSSLEHLAAWLPWARREPTSLPEKVELLRRFRGRFDLGQDRAYAIFDREEREVLGGTGLHPRAGPGAFEIGYWTRADVGGRGYAREAAAALTRVAFELDAVRRVEIHCAPENVRSAAIPRRLGYAHEATLRRPLPSDPDGPAVPLLVFTLFAEGYPGSAAADTGLEAFDAAGGRLL